MSGNVNAFEEPILELQAKIEGLKAQPSTPKLEKEITKLDQRLTKLQKEVYENLSDWQRCLVARHPKRPYTRDYIENLFEEYEEFHGDRRFADDPAIMAGFCTFEDQVICLVGHQKGRDIKQKLHRNFGMPRPEGYRKAMRIMKLAERFKRPIVCMIDTTGAYPGIDAEERGQAEAIARNLYEMMRIRVPILIYIIGEGGSGGALAIGCGDHVCILQNAVYSVISPEGCASILWKDAGQMASAAEALHLTAPKLKKLGIVDSILEEPPGGAHSDPQTLYASMRLHLRENLEALRSQPEEELLASRYRKFRNMGIYAQAG